MNVIESYLAKQDKILLEDRERTLIELGITEREYSPDGRKTWKYDKVDYIDGRQTYYCEVALKVTDEEYELITKKAEQVRSVEKKMQAIREGEQRSKRPNVVKKWLPIFERPKPEWFDSASAKMETGKSRMSAFIRIFSWLCLFALIIVGIATAVAIKNILPIVIYLLVGCASSIFLYALAEILDYLAELTTIMRTGFKYNESSK